MNDPKPEGHTAGITATGHAPLLTLCRRL